MASVSEFPSVGFKTVGGYKNQSIFINYISMEHIGQYYKNVPPTDLSQMDHRE